MKNKERTMPHVIVRPCPARSTRQKAGVAEEIVKDVVPIIKCDEKSV